MGMKGEIDGRTVSSTHTLHGWRGHLDRLRRWNERLRSIRSTRGDDHLRWDDLDLVCAVLQNCHVLREWLRKDWAAPRRKIARFVAGHQELRVCRDIANGMKHFRLSKPSVDAEFSIVREYVRPPVADGEPGHRYIVLADSKWISQKHDLLVLTDRCVELWERFVEQRDAEHVSRALGWTTTRA